MSRARKVKRQRGVALLMVLVALTILGSMTADLMESNEVYVASTVNARDSVKAEYMARSGVNLGRLLLSFQKLLGNQVKFPFWQYADLIIELFTDTEGGMIGDLTGMDLSDAEGLGLGIEDSELDVEILDEDSKINVNSANAVGRNKLREAMFKQLLTLMAPMEYDYIFERETKTGRQVTREDVVCEIMDWSDGDEDLCDMSGSEDPSHYQMLDPEYERKNAPFDSLEELHLVSGIDDDIWSAFVDPDPEDPKRRVMTVWGRGRINVNTAPAQVLFPLVCMMATDQSGISPCADPMVAFNLAQILQGIIFIRQFMPFKKTGDFIKAIINPETLFIPLPGFPLPGSREVRKMLTTRSTVFSIYADGTVGRVTKRIHVVVNMRAEDVLNFAQETSKPAAGGKILYWRMD